ncbi:MAG: hypothetical protein CL959_05645 [Euryarchaeota archaeon]|nr:hypothetical protein [Euryarchaeota archaeon]
MDATEQRPVKPEAVVINIPQNENLLAAAPISLPAGKYRAQQVAVSSILQKKRIQFASIALLVSMFFQWGYHYWLNWTLSSVSSRDGEGWDDGSHNTLWDYLMYGDFAWEGGIGFVEILNFFFRFQIWGDVADLVGPVFALFIMREFMPFVFIGTIVFCWVKRDKGDDFFHKVAIFYGGYFAIMAVHLIYINVELNGSHYWEFNLFLDCFGFWVAGFAGLLLDPKLIRIPDNIGLQGDTFTPHLNQPGWVQNSETTTLAPEQQTKPLTFALFYFPVVYYLIVVNSVMEGGDDDALFLGIMLPILGFLVGIGLYRLEFLKGFGLHLLLSIAYGFIAYFLVVIGFLSNLDDGPPISLVIMVSFILTIRYHLKNENRRAIGAMYAIPLTIWIIIIGLLIGWIQVEGW